MIIALANQLGGGATGIVDNLVVLRARDGRKVLLVDTAYKRRASAWARARCSANIRPWVATCALPGKTLAAEVAALRSQFNDIVIDTDGGDALATRSAFCAATLLVVPVRAQLAGLAPQYAMMASLQAARQLNPALRVLFVLVGGAAEPTAREWATVRAFVSRVGAATLARTVIHAPDGYQFGEGRCVSDGATCDPELAAEMAVLYREIYA
jgi:chromosome partitioning protein